MTTVRTNTSQPTTPWYKQFWPWFLIALPTTAVIGCLISITLAIKHADVPVQDEYEQHGLTVLHKTATETRDTKELQ